MAAKVARRRATVGGWWMKRVRWSCCCCCCCCWWSCCRDCGDKVGEEEEEEEEAMGVARTCWTFLEPARWVRMEGHLMARERSRWYRARHAVGKETCSAGV